MTDLASSAQPIHEVDDAARFWPKVHKTDGCWLWTASTLENGYGCFFYDGRAGYAHRWSYEEAVGPIPPGHDIDHKCRVRNCVNPDHLEPVTRRENIMRGESEVARVERTGRCKRGHLLVGNNIIWRGDGYRMCRACNQIRNRRRRNTA